LTTNVHRWHYGTVPTTTSDEKVCLVPGVEGPRWITTDDIRTASRIGGGVGVEMRIEYDDDQRRYVCTEFVARRTSDASEGRGFVTSETLRELAIAELIATHLYMLRHLGLEGIRELPNPDGAEPWGWEPPKDLIKEGPTDRALQWVAHLYHFGMAISMKPAKVVEDTLGLSHGTAARWVRLARQKGFLGPSEGPGRPAR
jgi:hypothetical protein